MAFKDSLARGLQKCIGNFCIEEDFSDFTVVVEATHFRCHKVILSACSGFFLGLLRSQMKECQQGVAKLYTMAKSTFEIILNSIYKGLDGLTDDTVLDVWSASELLQIDYMIEECKQFVMDTITVDNCLSYLRHATIYSAQNMIDHSLNFIIKHFNKVRSAETFLQLPFDYLYKVIESDSLETDSEDSVLETIMSWVNYIPISEPCLVLFTGTLDAERRIETLSLVSDSKNSSLKREGEEKTNASDQETRHQHQAKGNEQAERNDSHEKQYRQDKWNEDQWVGHDDEVNIHAGESNTDMPGNDNSIYKNSGKTETDNEDRNRTKYFKKLISACRYLLVKPTCLQNIMKNHVDLFMKTESFNLALEALMYTSSVEHHPDSWPDAAVHRSSSSNQHVMVFVSNDKFMAYSLNTGSTHKFASLPADFCKDLHTVRITVSGNVLYLQYEDNYRVRILSMITEQKQWFSLNRTQQYNSKMLVARGSCIYELCNNVGETTNILRRWFLTRDSTRQWSSCCTLEIGDCLIALKEYIIVFGATDNGITAHCYNTKTGKIHACTTLMDGTSQDMVSFMHRKDVYIIQRNGCLWQVFGTDMTPVNFKLVSKLWDFDYSLKGCVLYRKKLFIFCDESQEMDSSTPLISLPEIFEHIQMIKIDSRTKCLPMILPKSWFTS